MAYLSARGGVRVPMLVDIVGTNCVNEGALGPFNIDATTSVRLDVYHRLRGGAPRGFPNRICREKHCT